MVVPIWLYFAMLALFGFFLCVFWYGACKISRLQEEKETLASLVPQLQEYAQQLQKTHAKETSRLRAHHGAQTAKLQEDARQRQEAHAREISRVQGAMNRALQTQRAAHEEELAQLRAYHGEETAKLLETISQMKPASDEGMVEFDELEELWNKALKSTNATLRRRIKALETQVFENPEVLRLERKVNSQRKFMNRAATTIEILYAALQRLGEDPSLEVQELLGATRP